MIVTDETKIKCLRMEKEGIPRIDIYYYYTKTTGSRTTFESFVRTLRKWIVEYKDTDLTIEETNRLWLLPEEDKPAKRVVGVFSDVHLPFEHPNYLQFIVDTFIEWEVTDIVCLGDIFDHHRVSFHASHSDSYGSKREYELALEHLQPYIETFPKLKLTYGNHDIRPFRLGETLALHEGFIKNLHQSYYLPETWEIDESFIIDNVLYKHTPLGGLYGFYSTATNENMSTVTGHAHSNFGLKYKAYRHKLLYGMGVGCGVDNEAYAMEYGKQARNKPILGCGIVKSDVEAYTIPMTDKYFRKDN